MAILATKMQQPLPNHNAKSLSATHSTTTPSSLSPSYFVDDDSLTDQKYQDMYGSHVSQLSHEQKAALQFYTTGNYRTINAALREKAKSGKEIEPETQQAIDQISHSMIPTLEKLVVFRKSAKAEIGLPANYIFKNDKDTIADLEKKLVGTSFHQAGFLSTSTTASILLDEHSSFAARTVEFILHIEPGTRTMYLGCSELATYQGERELLLEPDLDLTVTGIKIEERGSGARVKNVLVIEANITKRLPLF